jgi:hypothetical protein
MAPPGSGRHFRGNFLKEAAAILWNLVPGSSAILWELAPESSRNFMEFGSREWPPFYGSWLQGAATILLEMALGSSRNYIVEATIAPGSGNCLKEAAAILCCSMERFYGSRERRHFKGVSSSKRPPFYGSWLQGATAILLEVAPGSCRHFIGDGYREQS